MTLAWPSLLHQGFFVGCACWPHARIEQTLQSCSVVPVPVVATELSGLGLCVSCKPLALLRH